MTLITGDIELKAHCCSQQMLDTFVLIAYEAFIAFYFIASHNVHLDN